MAPATSGKLSVTPAVETLDGSVEFSPRLGFTSEPRLPAETAP